MAESMDVDVPESTTQTNTADEGASERPSVIVKKPIPYTFDLGNLLVSDINPLPNLAPSNNEITAASRDAAQALINQLLTTCPITKDSSGELVLKLPPCTTPLPREKPLPDPKAETKWEKFARKKGIKAKRRDERSKKVYDEEKGEWVPKWGYKGKNKDIDDQWIVEVDEKREKEAEEKGATIRSLGRRERKDAVKRNERKQRSNERRQRKTT